MHRAPSCGVGPQPETPTSLLDDLKAQRVWLLWRYVPNSDPMKKPLKVPCYASGRQRNGELDSAQDRAQLVTYAVAVAAYEQSAPGTYAGIGYALGPDGRGGYWQGIDLDGISRPTSLTSQTFGHVDVARASDMSRPAPAVRAYT